MSNIPVETIAASIAQRAFAFGMKSVSACLAEEDGLYLQPQLHCKESSNKVENMMPSAGVCALLSMLGFR